ncbi:MAG: hypothetical protein PHH08_01390 [Candidatus ainarchaeum sp.]|nr:hypothetical protein [Candidatus ainarchaeum sp.]
MEKKNFLYLAAGLAVIAVVAWGAVFAVSKSGFAYNYTINGLIVNSDFADPKTAMGEFGNADSFIISPEMHETVSSSDHSVFSAANTFSVVLTGNKKDVIMLVRVLGPDNSLSYCMTNSGDVTTAEKISKEICLEQLASGNKARILIESPNSSVPVASVVLEKNKLTLKTSNSSQTGNAAFLAAAIIYSNAEEIIRKSNDIVGNALSGGLPTVN